MAAQYQQFARKHNLRLVEDAAHAFGCTCEGQKIGSTGDVVCFSFDGIKIGESGDPINIMTEAQAPEVGIRLLTLLESLNVQRESTKLKYQGRDNLGDVGEHILKYGKVNIADLVTVRDSEGNLSEPVEVYYFREDLVG